jgi:hypothetical protein
MEQSTQKRALGLKDKIPDIQKTLETVQFLKSRDVRLFLTGVIQPETNLSPIRRTTTNRLRRLSNSTILSSPRQTSRRSTRSTFGWVYVQTSCPHHPLHSQQPLRHSTNRSKPTTREESQLTLHPLPPGQRHALLPNPRSRRAPHQQAQRRTAESEQLRGRHGLPARASHSAYKAVLPPPDSHPNIRTTLALFVLLFLFLFHSPLSKRNCETELTCLLPHQTMEVATARVYNWDIGQKRKEEAAAAA